MDELVIQIEMVLTSIFIAKMIPSDQNNWTWQVWMHGGFTGDPWIAEEWFTIKVEILERETYSSSFQ